MAGEAIFPEKATGTAVGTAFGGVVVSLLPSLKTALNRVPNTESDTIVNQSEKEDPLDDGGEDKPQDESFISKNLPYILGGVALLGAGIYFYTKKK